MAKPNSGYPQRLMYYIWGWQVYFRISVETTAESLFDKIDTRLQPRTFLLGFNGDGEAGPVICYEPEDYDFLQEDLSRVNELADQLDAEDPDRILFYTGPGMNEEMADRRNKKNFRLAIQLVLDQSQHFSDRIHFVSQGVSRDGYKVYIILQLNKSVYLAHIFLNRVDPEERVKKWLSFIEAATDVFLEDQAFRMTHPLAGREYGPRRDTDEFLRAAANLLLMSVAFTGRTGAGFHRFKTACDSVCITSYEKKENFGHLIIARKDHPAIQMQIEIKEPFPITDYRKLRKELQLSDERLSVITDGENVYGIGTKSPVYDPETEDLFEVHFRGKNSYDVVHHENTILRMRYGVPDHPGELIVKSKFWSDARRIFSKISESQVENLYDVAMLATTLLRGCMLVFLPDAASEAERLKKQCIPINPVRINAEILNVLTAIDGALLIDLDGICHAKGVIMDGIVGLRGNPSRGSRYNSAITYQEYRGTGKPTMVVVVSDDGMVDVIPVLKPQIKHSEITLAIAILESLNSAGTFIRETFYDTMRYIQNREFYLTPGECRHINQLKNDLEQLDSTSGLHSMWIKHEDLLTNPEMNDSFYLPED